MLCIQFKWAQETVFVLLRCLNSRGATFIFFSTILLTSNRKKAFKWRDQHTEYNSFVFDGIVIEVTKTYLLCSSLSVLWRSNICSVLFHSSFVEHMEF